MRGTYTILFNGTITTAKTLLQIKAGAASIVELLRAHISITSTETSDTGEAQILRKSAAATVTSQNPLLLVTGDQAADAVGGTAATGDTATAEGTDTDILVREGFNVLVGWTWLPTPEERIFVPPGGFIGLKTAVTISSATVNAAFVFRELG